MGAPAQGDAMTVIAPVADPVGMIDMSLMKERHSGSSLRHRSIASLTIYVVLLAPASALAYIGLLWVGVSERGWRTQLAAAVLIVAWFPLVLCAWCTWTSTKTGSPPKRMWRAASIMAAVSLYAIAFAWGGRMLI